MNRTLAYDITFHLSDNYDLNANEWLYKQVEFIAIIASNSIHFVLVLLYKVTCCYRIHQCFSNKAYLACNITSLTSN